MKSLGRITIISGLICFVIYVLLFLFGDKTIDTWVHSNLAESKLFEYGSYISTLANGSYIKLALAAGFLLIVSVDLGLDKQWARKLLYICITCAIAIIIGEGLKFLLGRYRPIMLFDHDLYGLHFFSSQWTLNSTPSGHTIRAFSLLTALSMLHKRFLALFMTIAILIGMSRVAVTAHYPSDVLFGAYIGIFTAMWTYRHFFTDNEQGISI